MNPLRRIFLMLTAVCLTAGIPDADAQTFDPNTTVYIDALFCRAHAADCPSLILKEQKQTMTLEEADQLGYRIGESGQSGREEDDCCLLGYDAVRQYPKAAIASDAIGVAEVRDGDILKYHVHGCHRFTPDRDDYRMTKAEVLATPGGYICEHCLERGPGFAQMTQEEWDKLPSHAVWVPPLGWAPSPFPVNSYPQQDEIELLLSETLHGDIGIQERTFINPVATVDNFMIMRFFFPVYRWLELYQAYRSTGDTNVLEQLRGSARNYNTLSQNYLSAAQLKAKDPEGLAYMYTMAASARITLQLALKYPSQVTAGELAEAEEFLMTIISVLQPTCEDNSNLDPQMGIPKPLADDFRTRAFNRALNGIGTIGMATAALQDLQVLNSTTAYQSTIDRYRLIIQQYIINWKNTGFQENYNGKDYFSYPYAATDNGYWVGDVKLFGADDQGHFSHSMQGCYVLYDSVPELGIDDAFMTALANTIEFNSHTTSGSPQTPSQEAIRPLSRYPYGLPSDRFYLLQAFNDGVIDGQCSTLSALSTESVNSEYIYRLATFNAQYLKELRQDRTLIHMGEESVAPPAPPTGLSGIGSNGQVSLNWDDNTESDMVSGTYTVYRSTTSGSGYTEIANSLSSSAYVDNAVVNDTMYFYVVTATDSNGDGSAYSMEAPAAPFIPNATPPAAPTGLGAAGTDGSVSLDWDDNVEVDLNSYNIYRSTTSESYGAAMVTGVIPSDYVDTNVVNGTTYYYKVTAVDHSGNQSLKSEEIFTVPASYGPTITFGSNNDGYGGFASSAATGTEVWSLTATSVNYAFGLPATDEGHTASLLKSYAVNRSSGSSYTVEGVVDLTAGYGDDNNRIGLLLFNTTPIQTDDGGGGLYLRLNTDGTELAIKNGINGTTLASANATGSFSSDTWIGTTLKFTADLVFTNIAGTDKINISYTFTDGNNHADTLTAQVDAAGYTGTYCGFATKWRQRGNGGTEDAPPVMDYRSFMCTDNTPVVNQAPTANAGADQNVTDSDDNGSESVNLYGSGSSDPDGTIVSYVWEEGASQIATGVNPSVNLAVGSHTITLIVTDDDGAMDIDTVSITVEEVPNVAPTADAGTDQTVTDSDDNGSESVTLNGSGSSDPDGSIVSYVWKEGAAQIASGVNPSVNLAVGSHTITLTVTDNDGATDSDTVSITVDAAPNVAPTADAGSDQNVTDSDDNGSESVTLDGSGSSDPDGSIVSYVWKEGAAQIATGVNPSVNLAVGSHTITLTVTDNDDATDTDTVSITVDAAPNVAPTADAGSDQNVTDSDDNGSENVTLDGSGSSDPDGTIASYVWTEGGSPITTGVNPSVNLAVGVHTITLMVTDNEGATDSDQVTITVSATSSEVPPVSGYIRWFDASQITGVADGQPVSTWTDLSGNNANATVPSGNAAPVYIADAGTPSGLGALYFARNSGANDSAALRFSSVGTIRTVFAVFKGSSFLLTAASSYHFHRPGDTNPADPLWHSSWTGSNIRNGATYVNGVQVDGVVAAMPTGQNNGFNLVSVVTTDNVTADSFNKDRTYHAGNQYHAEVIIYDRALNESERLAVESYLNNKWFGAGPVNTPPTADAGADQTVTDSDDSGSESVTLDGSGSSDPDGLIVSYVWKEGTTQIATGVNPSVNLAVGSHTITLTVTDDDGATDSDTVSITVDAAPNVAPTAAAGSDQNVTDSDDNGSENVTLDGSGSSDPDGTIVSYEWSEGGSPIATGVNPSVNLAVGSHTITLTVTDNDDATDTDTVSIIVDAAVSGSTAPGLYYGTVSGNINTVDPNPESSVTTDLSETEDAIAANTTEIYTGEIYDADGNISFTEDIDDKTRLYIDGTLVLSSDVWSDRVSTANLNLTPGWHTFELRISNGSGGSGPHSAPGIGFDPNGGTSWNHPADPGDGSLFRHSTGAAPASPGVRVTEYYLTTGDFSGTSATLTLDQDLADDYYILVRGSRVGDDLSYPDNDYARVTAVPGGKGDLPDSGAANQITLGRFVADVDWEGVVTVVECENSASAAGFKLVDVVETPLTAASGTDSSAAWTDLSRVVLFGGYRGGGAAFTEAVSARNQGSSVYVRLYPSGTGTLNWSRNAAGETMFNAVMTTFVVEWGSEWTVQHVNVAGAGGGNGADVTGEYTTAAISAVTRSNSWVWATGTRLDAGIGDCAEACLVTLGDGVSQNASESTVAVGSETTDAYDFDVYVLTHLAIAVDYAFKVDGDANPGLDVAVAVDTAAAGARFGWVYNGCNGTGDYHPRSRFWARYTADGTVTISRGYDGQAFPAWVQGIDLSGLNP